MLQHWIVTSALALSLGLLMYACVRVRMHLGPRLRDRYGNAVRQAFWVITIIVLVALANLGLIGLRTYLGDTVPVNERLIYELWFAGLTFITAMWLIFRRVTRA